VNPSGVTLRPVCDDDTDLLFRIFKSVNEPTFAALEMPSEQKDDLLNMQFVAQLGQYRQQYPSADYQVILVAGTEAGSMYTQRGPTEWVLIDIALLPEFRDQGIGSDLVRSLISEAHASSSQLDAHVRVDNPAWRLWQRLGFEAVYNDGVYLRIRVPGPVRHSDRDLK
jgi:ribosomal protein S18 acetylase RimI-like enzyme